MIVEVAANSTTNAYNIREVTSQKRIRELAIDATGFVIGGMGSIIYDTEKFEAMITDPQFRVAYEDTVFLWTWEEAIVPFVKKTKINKYVDKL